MRECDLCHKSTLLTFMTVCRKCRRIICRECKKQIMFYQFCKECWEKQFPQPLKKYEALIVVFASVDKRKRRIEVLAPNSEHARGVIIKALEEDLGMEPLDYVIESIEERGER